MRVLFAALSAVLLLAACAGQSIRASDEAVRAAAYSPGGQPEIALITSINDRSGGGAHSALLINGSQKILFDPAGNWDVPQSPERDDVRFGMTPALERSFIDFQSKDVYHAVIQRRAVTPEVAEQAIRLALANGPVAPAFCTSATSRLLQKLPGFESLNTTMFPDSLMEQFAHLPGVKTTLEMGTPAADSPGLVPVVSPTIRKAVAEGR